MKRIFLLLFLALTLAEMSNIEVFAQGRKPRLTLAGSIVGRRVLSADTIYVLVGFVQVQQDAELVIPAGTVLEGDFASQGALLTVRGSGTGAGGNAANRRSGRITANGTATNPIVFTSQRPDGQKGRGNWGGIVLNGLAPNNGPAGNLFGEGNTGAHGGNTPNDTSGTLRYVRVEFGGTRITPDNEVNGFTFNSVGAGTTLEYLQSHFIADDAFEWFGGTVNARYLVATGCDDDNFDSDNSWIGKGQFWVGVEDRNLANRGYESDNNAGGGPERSSLGVLTRPTVYNVTLIGAGRPAANDDNNDGMYIRRNAQGRYWNHIVANFGGFGFVIDGSASRTNFTNDSLFVRNSIMFNRGFFPLGAATTPAGNTVWGAFRAGTPARYDTTGFYAIANQWNIRTVNPQFTRLDTANAFSSRPDLRPAPGSPALTGGATPVDFARFPGDATNFFDVTATYVGAFNATTDWTAGWTIWTTNATSSVRVDERVLDNRPSGFELSQNYPNPFNPTTNIKFSLPASQTVSLKVYDIAGREVATLINSERRAAGTYQLNFDGYGLSSGAYFYRLQAGNFVETKKMTLVK